MSFSSVLTKILTVIFFAFVSISIEARTIKSGVISVNVTSVSNEFPTGSGKTYTINPPAAGNCNEEFENVANSLKAGDVLVLKGGTYRQSCRRAISVAGNSQAYILIKAADGENVIITQDDPSQQNNLELDNSSYLILRGLRFQGGSSGIRFIGGNHIVLEQNEIFNTLNNAIPMNSGNSDSITIRKNHIHHTGQSTNAEGEGIYGGCNNNTCRVTNSLFEGNYIHDLSSDTSGGNDGIELKVGSIGNVVRHNVIHTTTIGTRYPCIFSYGGGTQQNIIEANVLFDCGEALQIVSDTIVRNNIVFNSDVGITAAPHAQVAQMKNVSVVNNTFYNNGTGAYIRWGSSINMIFANNAVYSPGKVALSLQQAASSIFKNNYLAGSGFTANNVGFFNGGNVSDVFVDVANMNFWLKPGSILIEKADSTYSPSSDFNSKLRGGAGVDVGAYETEGMVNNPGWAIIKGFKTYP